MSFFFFGTLRDPDVLALVLDRPLTDGDHVPARLPAHRTVWAATLPYPLVVPAEGWAAAGRLLLRPSRRDEERINWFEEDEYQPEWRIVETAQGPRRARVFFAREPIRPSGVAWDFARWRHEAKRAYLNQCAEWLRELEEEDGGAP